MTGSSEALVSDAPVLTAGVRSVNHASFTVSDLTRSIALWRDALGFTVVEGPQPPPDPGVLERCTGVGGAEGTYAMLEGPGLRLELLEYSAPDTAELSIRPCDPGFAHIALDVVDIDAAVAAVRTHGAEPVGPVATIGVGPARGTRLIYVRDWDGCTVELLQAPADAASQVDPEQVDREQVTALFTALDARDAAGAGSLLAADARLRTGNADALQGRDAIIRSLSSFWRDGGIVDQHHDIRGIWTGTWDDGPVASVEAEVTYRFADGRTATVQTSSTLRYRAGLVADYRIFGDLTPLSA